MTIKEAKRFLEKGDLISIARSNDWNYDYFIQVSTGKRSNPAMEQAIIDKGLERREELRQVI
ncbi:MAG: hypothetical protein NXI20_28695 [bacterium]|nr:hypothetical protein [bacterium]